jgi:hypothetical protein
MADLILGWNIMIGYNKILAIPIDRYANVINQLFERVDENVLLKEVLKTGNFSEDEAKLLIKKVKEEKVDGGMAWY